MSGYKLPGSGNWQKLLETLFVTLEDCISDRIDVES
jgi:hypothetical protein